MEGGRYPADHGEGEVLDRPGGGLGDGRGQPGGAVAGEDDASDAGALGTPEERAKVAGVGDAGSDEPCGTTAPISPRQPLAYSPWRSWRSLSQYSSRLAISRSKPRSRGW